MQHEKETAADFLQQILRPRDAGMVVSFADSVSLWQDFTASVDNLRTALTKVRSVLGPPPFEFNARQGGTVLYDAISVTATEKFKNRTGSKLLIVLSDGLDTNSSVTLETAIKSAQAMEVVVYGICNKDPTHQELEAYKRLHQTDAIRYSSGCDALKAIAEPTGGRMFEEGKNSNIKEIFDAIREEILGQYLLGFSPSNQAREGRFRTLDVKTKRRNSIVQARRGYYTFKRDEQ